MVSWRQVDEAMCTVVGFLVVVYVVYTIDWLRKLVQEVLRQFWPRDRRPTSVFLFLAVIAAAHAVPLLAWELDMKWLWPCSDFLRRLPWVLDDILASWADVWTGVVVMMQMLVSELAAVHWPVALLSLGAATIFMSGRAKQFWKCTVVSTLLLYFFRICFGHRGALSFSGDKAIDGVAVSAVVGLLCLATTPQGSMRHRLWSGVWSGLQYVFARIGYRRHFYNSTTAQLQPLRSRSLSSAASGEVFATDAETASTPGICITADGSTASHQAAHHAAGFSASSQMPKAPVSGSNEASDASRPDDGTSLCIRSSTTSTEADHPKFVCFWLGASCGNVIELLIVICALKAVDMETRLAQHLWCNMQRVQRCVKGFWAPNSPSMSSTLPFIGMQASVSAAAMYQASAARYTSPRNMHQPMAQQFMSGGPPSVRPLHSTAGYSSPAMQQEAVAGGHGNVSAAVPDQDVASDGESEVFVDADEVMQPDLLQTEAPFQASQSAALDRRGTDDFPGWRQPVTHLRAKLRRSSSVTINMSITRDVPRLRTRRSVKERIKAVRRRATPACMSVL